MSKKPPLFASRLSPDLLLPWFSKHPNVTPAHIREGRPCWQTADGLVPLTIEDVEELCAFSDPVAFARLYLTEERDLVDDDGEVVIPKGAPWALYPVQARMARLAGDVVFECGSEVGKTRDIVNRALWRAHTSPGAAVLVANNNESTAVEIFSAIRFQVESNPILCGGLRGRPQKAPFHEFRFENGSQIQLRLVGAEGEQLRGAHGSDLLGDECAKWRSPQCFSEFYRAALPGAAIRLYSTPDGNYSSPFFGLCSRAKPIDGRTFTEKKTESVKAEGERGFRKFNIAKTDLPAPFWTPARAEKFRAQYGGEDSVGYQTNCLGRWSSPSFSVFPMDRLQPCLRRDLSHYRIVVVRVDRKERRVELRAAQLASDIRGERETLLANDGRALLDGKDLGAAVARFFPQTADWPDAKLFCGADLGSAQDPSEFIFLRIAGGLWVDVFRLHLRNTDWTIQADVVAALDHAAGHRVRYGFDNGSAGAALAQNLRGEHFASCLACRADSHLDERLSSFDFGRVVDEINVETGETMPDPNNLDAAGVAKPHRTSNKEFSTRVLERKVAAASLAIADDAGAGDASLGAAQLLVNHTSLGVTSRGERRFRGEDDHAVDSRRMAALAIAQAIRDEGASGFVGADPALIAGIPRGVGLGSEILAGSLRGGDGRDPGPYGTAVEAGTESADPFLSGSVRGGFRDW